MRRTQILKLLRTKGIAFNEESDTEELFKLLMDHSFDGMGEINGERKNHRITQ
jgi:hypothetical protein